MTESDPRSMPLIEPNGTLVAAAPEVKLDTNTSDDLLEVAWIVIANALDWDREDRGEWRTAAERWRDDYFTHIAERRPHQIAEAVLGAVQAPHPQAEESEG